MSSATVDFQKMGTYSVYSLASPTPSSNSIFFILPLEIRQEIYSYVLQKYPLAWGQTYPRSPFQIDILLPDDGSALKRDTSLLRVNRQISVEASSLFYTKFTFRFAWYSHIRPFLAYTPVTSHKYIRNISLHWKSDGSFLTQSKGMRSLHIAHHTKVLETFTFIAEELPNLRRVRLDLMFLCLDLETAEREGIIDEVVALARPFQDVVTLVSRLHPFSHGMPLEDVIFWQAEIFSFVAERVEAERCS